MFILAFFFNQVILFISISIFFNERGKLFRFSVLYSRVCTDESNTHAPTDYLNATKATFTEIRRIAVWLFSGVNIHTCIIQIAVFGMVHQLYSIIATPSMHTTSFMLVFTCALPGFLHVAIIFPGENCPLARLSTNCSPRPRLAPVISTEPHFLKFTAALMTDCICPCVRALR